MNDILFYLLMSFGLAALVIALLFIQGSFLVVILDRGQHVLERVHPVVVDGLLYVIVAIFGAILGILTSDEVYKYANPYLIFYSKAAAQIVLQGANALKMFRSNSYAEYRTKKDLTTQPQPASTEAETKIP